MNEPLVYEEIRRVQSRLKMLSLADARKDRVEQKYWELVDLWGYLPEDLRAKAWVLGMERGL